MMTIAKVSRPILVLVMMFFASSLAAQVTCKGEWRSAALTNYESYPDPGSVECVKYNGCKWAGQFYGVNGKKSEKWVSRSNIAAVHQKHWREYGGKTLRLRKNGRELLVKVLDGVEFGFSEPAYAMSEALFAAQFAEYQKAGRLVCVSEAPINREPWFIYQGFQ